MRDLIPTKWQTGDVVTSAKLNRLEKVAHACTVSSFDNILSIPGDGADFVIQVSVAQSWAESISVNKTYAEIDAAVTAADEINCVGMPEEGNAWQLYLIQGDDGYYIAQEPLKVNVDIAHGEFVIMTPEMIKIDDQNNKTFVGQKIAAIPFDV